jgi:hypothetical protein
LGKVYFIQGKDSGIIKIGYTSKPTVDDRFRAIQSCSPEVLHVLYYLDGNYSLESYLHRVFSEERLHGEWFSPSAALLAFVSDLAHDNVDHNKLRETADNISGVGTTLIKQYSETYRKYKYSIEIRKQMGSDFPDPFPAETERYKNGLVDLPEWFLSYKKIEESECKFKL